MIIECEDAAGFEDQLTDYMIANDNDESLWYGAMKFKYVRDDV
jgi:hypothetical protein